MNKPILFETQRLTFRQMDLGDIDDLRTIFSDAEAMRYYPSTKNITETEGWIAWNQASYVVNGFGLWVAALKETGEFAGQCGLVTQIVNGRQEVEVGYLFRRSLWNRGLATEAARACADRAFHEYGRTRLIALIDPCNLASRRVALKIGMRLEQEIEKWNKRVCVYSMEKTFRTEERIKELRKTVASP